MLDMPPFTQACAKQLTVNTDGPDCCRMRGEHLYETDLMLAYCYYIAIPYGNSPQSQCVCVCVALNGGCIF